MKAQHIEEIEAKHQELAKKFNAALAESGLPHLSISKVTFAANATQTCPAGQHGIYINIKGAIVFQCVPN